MAPIDRHGCDGEKSCIVSGCNNSQMYSAAVCFRRKAEVLQNRNRRIQTQQNQICNGETCNKCSMNCLPSVSLVNYMIRTSMFPTSPMMNSVMITATSVHHCRFFFIARLKESWSMCPFCEWFLPRTYSPYKCHVFSAAATLTNLRVYHYYNVFYAHKISCETSQVTILSVNKEV